MKHAYATVVVLFTIAILFEVVKAKEWRGITPLHSMRADVERLLGEGSSKKQLTTYQTEKEAVQFYTRVARLAVPTLVANGKYAEIRW